jgi:RNA polymerase sigma factor (sigma-70 family)
MDEYEAVARAKRSELAGLEALVQLHQQSAVRLAAFITRDRQMAEDIVSDAFLTAFDRIAQFDAVRPFKPWFHRIVANAALKAVKKRRRIVSLDEDNTYNLPLHLIGGVADPADAVEASEMQSEVRRALAALSPKQRAVIALRYYSEFSEAETAAALNIPPGTVKSRLSAGMQRLRTLLARWH